MWLKPDAVVEHVTDINLDALWAQGVRGFIFDLDNTLIAPHTGKLEEPVSDWLKHIAELEYKAVVVSNNPIAVYIKEVEQILDIPIIGNAGKPRRKYLRRGLEILGLEPHQVAVVGDRPLTDIWGGHRLGARTILVDPLTKHTEHRIVQFLRRLERMSIHPGSINPSK